MSVSALSTSFDSDQEGPEQLSIKVLGRTLEHLGVQMYKKREAALAELVANSWDAGATAVEIEMPPSAGYSRATSVIRVRDNGAGMTFNDIKGEYLVVGRNRRKEHGLEAAVPGAAVIPDEPEPNEMAVAKKKRLAMGRKGIGKLAGFGLASTVTVRTWREGSGYEFRLDLENLKLNDAEVGDVDVPWTPVDVTGLGDSGTVVTLSSLKHTSPPDADSVAVSLARRFSRTTKGEMTIKVNDTELPDPTPALDYVFPKADHLQDTVVGGSVISYWYGFAQNVIRSKELRGFSILVNGKVAQAPPFFFDVEATASGQHSTKYVIGEIEADYLDTGTDDESDLISTDRQEIDWESPAAEPLRNWGQELARRVLAECRDFRGGRLVQEVYDDPVLRARIMALESTSQKQINEFLKTLGLRDADDSNLPLADALVRAYEFKQFHDVIAEIQEASDDPHQLAAFLERLNEWKTLESRAVLEVIQGRLDIIDRFEKLIVTNAPETAPSVGADNMHDALAAFPWLLSPDWQVLSEEKSIGRQLAEWSQEDIPEGERDRYDFLALSNDERIVVIEIKRSGHPVTIQELQRLISYRERLAKARPNIYVVLVYGGTLAVSEMEQKNWQESEDRELRLWSDVFAQSRRHYERYRAVLASEVDHPNFAQAQHEVAAARRVLQQDSVYRSQSDRRGGLGPQDTAYVEESPKAGEEARG